MRVNVFGIVVILAGLFLIFLGVTGRYKAFTGGSPTSSSNKNNNSAAEQAFNPFPPEQTKNLPGLLPPGWPFLSAIQISPPTQTQAL